MFPRYVTNPSKRLRAAALVSVAYGLQSLREIIQQYAIHPSKRLCAAALVSGEYGETL